jgi:hypothetical protein
LSQSLSTPPVRSTQGVGTDIATGTGVAPGRAGVRRACPRDGRDVSKTPSPWHEPAHRGRTVLRAVCRPVPPRPGGRHPFPPPSSGASLTGAGRLASCRTSLSWAGSGTSFATYLAGGPPFFPRPGVQVRFRPRTSGTGTRAALSPPMRTTGKDRRALRRAGRGPGRSRQAARSRAPAGLPPSRFGAERPIVACPCFSRSAPPLV